LEGLSMNRKGESRLNEDLEVCKDQPFDSICFYLVGSETARQVTSILHISQ
jgi:hypothetical protein